MSKNWVLIILVLPVLAGCGEEKDKMESKGFQVNEINVDEDGKKVVGLPTNIAEMETRARNVLLTFHPEHRLVPIYKVNYHSETKEPFTGSTEFHTTWYNDEDELNRWHGHLMPGFEAAYGYNFVNISHYNQLTDSATTFFDTPVLIKTLYFPAFGNDTLNGAVVRRSCYLVSVYDEDTNKDGFINMRDLRRIYAYNLDANGKKMLVPKNYSVMSSTYDPANDFMIIYARFDKNNNGQMEGIEPTDIFWVDLNNPENSGSMYVSEKN